MNIAVRSFVYPWNDKERGCIWVVPLTDGNIFVNVIDMHGDHGEACCDVACSNNLGLFENISSIFKTLTSRYGEGYKYNDFIVDGNDHQTRPFNVDNVSLLLKGEECIPICDEHHYIAHGEIDANGKFTYDELKSNHVRIEDGQYVVVT